MQIARNRAVFCMLSRMQNMGICIDYSLEDIPDIQWTRDVVLRKICHEDLSYNELYQHYCDATNGIENEYFSKVYPVDDSHFIRITKENEIIMYQYQDRIHTGGNRLFLWDYPHLIWCIGHADKSQAKQICDDYRTMSVIDFFMNYRIGRRADALHITKKADGTFDVDGFFHICIHQHVVFKCIDAQDTLREYYVSDTWWETDEEIISDLSKLSVLSFSEKYNSIQCLAEQYAKF